MDACGLPGDGYAEGLGKGCLAVVDGDIEPSDELGVGLGGANSQRGTVDAGA